MLVVDVLYAGAEFEMRLPDQALVLAMLPAQVFLLDQQAERRSNRSRAKSAQAVCRCGNVPAKLPQVVNHRAGCAL
jgi:hypothetical protein